MNQQPEVKPEVNVQQTQEVSQQQTASQTPPPESEPSHSSEVQKDNWRKFREQKDLERKQRIEAEKMAQEERSKAEALKAAMEALLNKPAQSNEYHQEETEEQRIDKKVQEALAKRENEYQKNVYQKEMAEYPQKLVQNFTDFNQVCTTENLDYLEYHYPELAAPFKHMPEGYEKWSSIYKAVKRLVPNPDSKREAQKAEKNFQKPQSISGRGQKPKSPIDSDSVGILDDQRKAENWQRMQKALKGLS